MRLSTINLAGTARTDVAVGISKLASMLVTTRAEVPLSFSITSSASDAGAGLALVSACADTCAGAEVVGTEVAGAEAEGSTTGWETVAATDLVAVA